MAMSDAERKRRSRQRQADAQRASIQTPPADPDYLKASFAGFLADRHLDLYENLDAFGVFLSGSTLDSKKQEFQSQVVRDDPLTPLERTIGILDAMTDACRELAETVNAYKLQEIAARIAEIEQADLSDPQAKAKALADIVRLQKMQDQLTKQVRIAFPQWKVAGE